LEKEPAKNPNSELKTDVVKPSVPSFNADSAYIYTEKQVLFGPRNPGSPAHAECKTYLLEALKTWADTAFLQSFEQTVYGRTIGFSNIIASFNTTAKERVLLCAHWDSRPYSDEDPIRANLDKPVPAANDGASGAAILLEIARNLKISRPGIGIDIILFDGEDYGKPHDLSQYFIGSRYVAAHYPLPRPRYAILLDLVGDKNAEFRFEPLSMQSHDVLMRSIWSIARKNGYSQFIEETGNGVSDDHEMLIKAGIRAIDIIDVNLVGNLGPDPRRKYWHTQGDTMDNIGKNTLEAVGQTLLEFLFTRAEDIF
jgi:Zn-dependent M28 family amino/carboxypeptidase